MLSRTSTSAVVPRSTGEFSDFLGRSALEPVKTGKSTGDGGGLLVDILDYL